MTPAAITGTANRPALTTIKFKTPNRKVGHLHTSQTPPVVVMVVVATMVVMVVAVDAAAGPACRLWCSRLVGVNNAMDQFVAFTNKPRSALFGSVCSTAQRSRAFYQVQTKTILRPTGPPNRRAACTTADSLPVGRCFSDVWCKTYPQRP